MTVTGQVVRFVVDANLEGIPQKTVQYAKQLALSNLGFTDIHHMDPGQMAIVEKGKLRVVRQTSRAAALCRRRQDLLRL